MQDCGRLKRNDVLRMILPNLLPVGMEVNRTKGAYGPLEWLPPTAEFNCEYLLRFSRVVTRYELDLSAEENAALEQLTAEKCDSA